MRIINTTFSKGEEKKITFQSGDCRTQIDYALLRKEDSKFVKDCKVIPGEECLTQHRRLAVDLVLEGCAPSVRRCNAQKIKIWKLREQGAERDFEEKFKQKTAIGKRVDWEQFQANILSSAKEVCGVTSWKRRQVQRETWWWNVKVQTAIGIKKNAYKRWQKD